MRVSRRLKWFLWIIAIIAVFVGIHYLRQIKYHPWRNPDPKYFLTITGHVDPEIKDIVKLKWVAVYGSSTRNCDMLYNWFSDNYAARVRRITFSPNISPSGDYSIKIPLDYFKPGYCQWQIYNIDNANDIDQANINDVASFVIFYPCGHSINCFMANIDPKTAKDKYYQTSGYANYIYSYDKNHKLQFAKTRSIKSFNNNMKIPRMDNYLYEENYYLARSK